MTAVPDLARLAPGQELPVRTIQAEPVQLFLYNAALWNADRIHFDYPHTTAVEGYPALVMAGPLLGDWLAQAANNWVGDAGVLCSIEYSNRRACYVGDVLRSVGKVKSVNLASGEVVLELAILNQADEVTTPGTAVVRIGRP
jgi:hydroxyacyl-ACP dehydratase HTD2-like protein with hotdog domain